MKNTDSTNPYLFSILEAGLEAKTIKNRSQRFIKWVNKRMYEICAELGIENKTSTYAARHTFATVLKCKCAPISFVKDSFYRVKEILLQKGIASQVIVKKNISYRNLKYYLPNIEVAILAKLVGIPWRQNRKPSNDLVVGIGAFYSKDRKTRYIGSTSYFDNDGTVKGFDCFGAEDTKLLAGSIRRAVITYVAQFEKIKRLIIHFYKDISKKGLQSIQQTLHKSGLNIPRL